MQSWAGFQKTARRACISQPLRRLLRAAALRPSGGDACQRVLLEREVWPSALDSTTSCPITPNRLIPFVLPIPPLRPRRPLRPITDCCLLYLPLLPLQPPPLRPPRQHDYTCENPSGQAYIAMYNNRQFGGLHTTDHGAAKAVADFLGIDVKTLRREPQIGRDIASRLFKEMFSIYASAGTPRRL